MRECCLLVLNSVTSTSISNSRMVLASPGPLPTPPPSSSPPKLVSSCSCVRACIYLIYTYSDMYISHICTAYIPPLSCPPLPPAYCSPLLRFMLLTEPGACASTRARPPSAAPLPPRCGSASWPSSMGSRPTGTAHTHRHAHLLHAPRTPP